MTVQDFGQAIQGGRRQRGKEPGHAFGEGQPQHASHLSRRNPQMAQACLFQPVVPALGGGVGGVPKGDYILDKPKLIC